MRLKALACVATLAACDAGPTEPSKIAEPAGAPRFEILDMATILKDESVHEAATGHAVTFVRLTFPPTTESYSFSAVRLRDGSVTGQFERSVEALSGQENIHGTVLCLRVEENSATIGGVVEKGSSTIEEGTTVVWHVVDVGESAHEPDLASHMIPGAPVTEECVVTAPSTRAVTQGDVQVHEKN